MAEKKSTKKTVTFREQEVTLKFPLLAVQRLEEVGVDIGTFGDEENISITALGKIVWAGLSCQFNDATLDEVLMAYEISDLQNLSEAISQAFGSMGK